MTDMPLFSIIIPVFNAQDTLADCVRSCFAQDMPAGQFEILVIDDGSTDASYALACGLGQAGHSLRVARTAANGGPGIARNVGLDMARGEWILFLDADDALAPDALSQLAGQIGSADGQSCDAIGFDWRWAGEKGGPGQRRDQGFLALDKAALIERYLRLHMDGAVIFTAVRASLLRQHAVRFAGLFHEDVDVLFRIYWHARRVGYCDQVLYVRRARAGSIVHGMSRRHIEGFVRAWLAIGAWVMQGEQAGLQAAWRIGAVAVLATRVREISRLAPGGAAGPLLMALYDGWQAICRLAGGVDVAVQDTQYFRIARAFLEKVAAGMLQTQEGVAAFLREVEVLARGSWSCTDLHHSVFLAPDQVRTCCKRYFVGGERRGDVVLLAAPSGDAVTPQAILAAKAALHVAINRGEATPCTGCPFLEFAAWGPIGPLRVRYLSLEYHSVCNLQCSYCDETYYGGARPAYDVKLVVGALMAQGSLDAAAAIVWGGGEPVIDRDFVPLLESLAAHLPRTVQRVLSNAVRYSPVLARRLRDGQASLTTSLDAGTREVFGKIRGRDRFARVIGNLRKYAAENAAQVTLKYIFTQGNEKPEEGRAFVAAMREAGLLGCNFQISHDFKSEHVDLDVLAAIIAMHAWLVAEGCEVVFLDDLLRQRLTGLPVQTEAALRARLAGLGVGDALLDADAEPELVVWGAGWQAKFCLERANFFRHRKPAFLVDGTPAKIGGNFMGLEVRDPASLVQSECKVLIAASQAYPIIYQNFLRLGLAPERLVRKVLI